MTKRKLHTKRGGLALEAAIVMPIMLVTLTTLLALQAGLTAEIKLKGALDRTAAEISLLVPLCDLVLQGVELSEADQVQILADMNLPAPITSADDQPLFSSDLIMELISDGLFDLASSALLAPFIHQRLDIWLDIGEGHHAGFSDQIINRKLFLHVEVGKNQLWLCVDYQLKGPFGRGLQRYQQVVVPLWTGSRDPNLLEDQAELDGVWMLDNFSRGQILRDYYGADLPFNFPVIAAFSNGRAVSIKSMDLTAPSYQDTQVVRRRLRDQVRQLSDFNGATRQQEGRTIEIKQADIQQRSLLMIIPGNSPQAALQVLNDLKTQAAAAGVDLQWRIHGNSRRYQENEPDQDSST